MNNTVLVENKIRQKLKLVCTVLCVFCIMFIAFLVSVVMIDKQNLNGQVTEVSGVIDKAYETDSNVITMQDGKEYNAVWSDDIDVDFNNYKGTAVTLIVTQKTFANSNPWILGLIVNGNTIVDYQETLNYKRTVNGETRTAVIALTAILCVATCGFYIWRFNLQPLVERELYHEFAEFLSQRQPTCPERKKLQIGVYVYLGLILVLAVLLASFGAAAESDDNITVIVIAAIFGGIALIGAIALLIATRLVFRKEIDFYADKLPFDFNDISHAPIRKKIKEELQKQILKEREDFPDTYADGGNGYEVTFGEKGVTLSIPNDDTPIEAPKAEEVFAYNDGESEPSILTPADNAYPSNDSADNVLNFTYEQLNLEAVAHYRKQIRPMMIIVKSRLTRTNDFPEEFVNDIHIPLDLNLLYTLGKYNVEVENLNHLMNNCKQLMMENCLTQRKKNSKMMK